MKNPKRDNKLILFLFIILTVVFTVVTSLVSRMNLEQVDIFFVKTGLSSSQVAGVLTSVRLIFLLGIVMNSYKHGVKIANTIIVVSSLAMIMGLINGNLTTIPGLANALCSFMLVEVIHTFMKKEAKQHGYLQMLSEQEPLTGMNNRRRVHQEINRLLDEEQPFYMAFLSVDNFKAINDTIGRDYGDKVLIALANRLKAMTREGEFGGKITGAEFVLLIKSDAEREVIEERLIEYLNQVNKPVTISNIESVLEFKTAVVKSPEDGTDLDVLYRHLDDTLNYSRTTQGKKIAFFDESITNDAAEASKIEDRLFKALDENLLHLVFQPQYTAGGKKLRGFETLSRLEDDDGNPIRPDKFITVAERTNLIFKVDDWVLSNAIKQFKPIVREHDDLVISVNISARHFQKNGFAMHVLKLLKDYDYPTKNLEIEITETAFVESMDVVKECMQQLRDAGVKIALDDFGTGYASLSYLSQLPVNLLKIDKSFIDKLNRAECVDNDFVKVIISMGHILNMEVISEGVEYDEQRNMLNNWGCDLIQGYLWGKPMDINKAKELCRTQ